MKYKYMGHGNNITSDIYKRYVNLFTNSYL